MTVTVWATFQSPAVKVSDEGETVPSVVSELERPMTTLAVGSRVSTTVKVGSASPAASVVVSVVAESVMPAVSLSVIVAVTCWVPLSDAGPVTESISTMIVSLLSSTKSPTPVRVTVPVVCPAVIVMLAAERV